MKKLTYLTLIAAFVFGVQPQEAFSNESNVIEMAEAGNGEARIDYDGRREVLVIGMKTGGDRERAQVIVEQNSTGKIVVKEVFLVEGRGQSFELDMSGLEGGAYSVKVSAPSFREASRFKKK